MSDRRQGPRYPCQLRVGIIYPDGKTKLLWAHDISDRGLSLHCDQGDALGTALKIVVFVYSVEAKGQIGIHASARICNCVFDSLEGDFRIGLFIEDFEADGEAAFQATLEYIASPLIVRANNAGGGDFRSIKRIVSFPLRRRIKLTLEDGTFLPGWTENVTPSIMRVNLTRKLFEDTVYALSVPIVLPNGGDVVTVQAKATVQDITFRPMGSFATQLQVFDYQNNGDALLKEELCQRFPEAQAMFENWNEPEQTAAPSETNETEALQPLAAGRNKPTSS
ncbi:PilZ domain-containing protein [Thiospirillum jenense]|uniref:PilZ domain-containing protein n=1 Tax=Thiospirillum jenense TaxID=1653858 RepID=A0A839H729_9GAMM|nr:PilZ domain-containing protein [Thiospirillum jenense]MBB1125084.1 PilZ domain-containing protein [Thiospirillum jenense]